MNGTGHSGKMKKCGMLSKFILYSPYMNSFIHKITRILDGPFQKDRYEVYVHLKELKVRLRQRQDICSAILIAPTQYDLDRILRLQRLLDGLPLLMILPDGDSDTISKAHKFRPRFLTYVDGDFSEIIGVIEKIAKNFNQQIHYRTLFDRKPG